VDKRVASAYFARMKTLPDSKSSIAWRTASGPIAYPEAVSLMEQRVAEIADGRAGELVWLLEHPPIYTGGTSARLSDLLEARFPVYQTGRGGQYTYHGPGQRIAYVMLDLRRRKSDVRRFVHDLEEWLILALSRFGIRGETKEGRVGIWVGRENGGEDKIAAIGVRVRRWVTYHGVALNVTPDLDHYSGIVPCGIRGHGVTSFAQLGVFPSMTEVDQVLKQEFEFVFGRASAS